MKMQFPLIKEETSLGNKYNLLPQSWKDKNIAVVGGGLPSQGMVTLVKHENVEVIY